MVARDGRTVALLPLPFPPNPDPTSKAKPAVDTKVTCTYRRADVRAFIPQRRRRLRCLVRYDSCPSSPARLPRGVFVVVVVVVDFQCLLTHLHTSHVLHMCNKRYTSELPHYILCPFFNYPACLKYSLSLCRSLCLCFWGTRTHACHTPKAFTFDKVYPPQASQAEVYEFARPLVLSAVDG